MRRTLPAAIPALALSALLCRPASAQPAGFTKTQIAPNNSVRNGTSLAHASDGRIFAAEIGGTVKVLQGGTVKTVHSVSTNTEREQGLLKMEIHPKFAQNGWLYLYYLTANKHHHNIDRITVDKDNRVTESKTLVELVPLTNQGRHNGSGMVFGKDGFLYVGRGEDEQEHWASQWTTQRGKILRFTEDGKPAPGNPHAGAATVEEQSIWARGFRNPWSLTMDPASGRIFEGEVGAQDEEINDVTQPAAGMDHWYGWGGGGDGGNQNANTIKPFFSYATGSLGCAITGVAAYNAPGSTWPANLRNRVYFVDWCQPFLRSVDIANPAASEVFFANGMGKALGLTVGIDAGLYWIDHNTGGVWRVSNTPFSPTPTSLGSPAGGARPMALLLHRDRGGNLVLPLPGPAAEGPATLRIFRMDGALLATRSASIRDSQISVSWGETSGTPMGLFRVDWRGSDGSARAESGRFLIAP